MSKIPETAPNTANKALKKVTLGEKTITPIASVKPIKSGTLYLCGNGTNIYSIIKQTAGFGKNIPYI